MDWVLKSPQIHGTFSNLGYIIANGYHINDNCNDTLRTILRNIITEDKYQRSYRRSIHFGQNVQKDLIPLLKHSTDDKSIDLIIQILVNLTVPVECLVPVEVMSNTDVGRHTIFEINNLLASIKLAVTDCQVTKVLVGFLMKNVGEKETIELTTVQCANICNTLIFLRNVLNIPDNINSRRPYYIESSHSIQNQILWNLFSQSMDKLFIKLINIPEAYKWAPTIVQLLAILYKDQHSTKLNELLKLASSSENSEDNESNTSPNRGSTGSCPLLKSAPASDSSDSNNKKQNSENPSTENNTTSNCDVKEQEGNHETSESPPKKRKKTACTSTDRIEATTIEATTVEATTIEATNKSDQSKDSKNKNNDSTNIGHKTKAKKRSLSNNDDSKSAKPEPVKTQAQSRSEISVTTSGHKITTKKKVVSKKLVNSEEIILKEIFSSVTLMERKKQKILKTSKTMLIVKGLANHSPTDDEITTIIKDFTVHFLLKGYNSLIHLLHTHMLSNLHFEIDTSHFFWLLAYFLKFATQIELDLKLLPDVLSFNLVSYLTAEGVSLCEKVELGVKLDENNLEPVIKKLHLAVTAVREIILTIKTYKNSTRVSDRDKKNLVNLQIKLCETDELRLFILLVIRHFNSKYQSKQYLKDLVVTNHILLQFLEGKMNLNSSDDCLTFGHLHQFATPVIMSQYGLLLEDYAENGEYLNDCIFTIMYHVAMSGAMDSLCQPKILKVYTTIWKSDFKLDDEWLDVIEIVMKYFENSPLKLQSKSAMKSEENDSVNFASTVDTKKLPSDSNMALSDDRSMVGARTDPREGWSEEELSSLSWYYMQCNSKPDLISEVVKLFKEDGIVKSRESIITALLDHSIINKDEFEKICTDEPRNDSHVFKSIREMTEDDIGRLCEQLALDDKCQFLTWLQTVLLEACYVKIHFEKSAKVDRTDAPTANRSTVLNSNFKMPNMESPGMSPVSYHSLLHHESIPLVPWTCHQAAVCKDIKFLKLSHKLGFHMPVDTGKVFIRIPHFWTSDDLYEAAGKILPVDTTKIKFPLSDISRSSVRSSNKMKYTYLPTQMTTKTNVTEISENIYDEEAQRHFESVINSTHKPGIPVTDVSKPSWIELVQKSRSFQILLDMPSPILDRREYISKNLRMMHKAQSSNKLSTSSKPSDPLAVFPNIMTVKQTPLYFIIDPAKNKFLGHKF